MVDTQWFLAYTFEGLILFFWILFIYARIKRNKYGQETTAEVKRLWIEYERSKNASQSTKHYYVKFSFINDVTHLFLPKLFYKFTLDGNHAILPQELINICMEYIGYNQIQFWYGPYTVEKLEINQIAYVKIVKLEYPRIINIIYDTDDPYNAQIANTGFTWKDFTRFASFCGCSTMLGFICVMGTIWTLRPYDDNDKKVGMLTVSISLSLVILAGCMTGFIRRACCNKKKQKLQVRWNTTELL